MRTILQGFLLFLLWASFGRWYYVCKVKSHCTPSTEEARLKQPPKTLGIYYSDSLLHRGFEQFVFTANSGHARFTSNNTSFLNRLIRQMRRQQELEVLITGFYLKSEAANLDGTFENLGEVRASKIQEWLEDAGIAAERIQIRSEMVEGKRLIEPLKFHFVSQHNATAGN